MDILMLVRPPRFFPSRRVHPHLLQHPLMPLLFNPPRARDTVTAVALSTLTLPPVPLPLILEL
jgi:hypothetical protein